MSNKSVRQRFEDWAGHNGWNIRRTAAIGQKYVNETQCAWRGFEVAMEERDLLAQETRAFLVTVERFLCGDINVPKLPTEVEVLEALRALRLSIERGEQ